MTIARHQTAWGNDALQRAATEDQSRILHGLPRHPQDQARPHHPAPQMGEHAGGRKLTGFSASMTCRLTGRDCRDGRCRRCARAGPACRWRPCRTGVAAVCPLQRGDRPRRADARPVRDDRRRSLTAPDVGRRRCSPGTTELPLSGATLAAAVAAALGQLFGPLAQAPLAGAQRAGDDPARLRPRAADRPRSRQRGRGCAAGCRSRCGPTSRSPPAARDRGRRGGGRLAESGQTGVPTVPRGACR